MLKFDPMKVLKSGIMEPSNQSNSSDFIRGFYLCLDGRTRLKQRLFDISRPTLVNLPFYELAANPVDYLKEKLQFVLDDLFKVEC